MSAQRLPTSTSASAISLLAGIARRPLRDQVVHRQVGAARLAPSARDPAGEQVARRVVRHAPRLEYLLGGAAGRFEARFPRRTRDGPERPAPAGLVAALYRRHEPVRHVPPDRRLAEGPRPGDEGRNEGGRVAHDPALAPGPLQHGYLPSVPVEYLDASGPHAAHELAAVPGGARAVAVASDLDVAALVRLRLDPPHGVEGDPGQRQHRREVLLKGVRDRPAVAAARDGVHALAPGAQYRVELVQGADGGLRHQEVAPQEPHGVLRRPLLVARVGVAVAARATVVGPEPGEQGRFGDLAAHHAPRLGGVVQHEQRGRAPDLLEGPAQPVAEALGALGEHGDAVAGVRMGQRAHQQLQVARGPGDLAAEVAEVDLGGSRRPPELEVPVARGRGRVGLPPSGHVAARRGAGAP